MTRQPVTLTGGWTGFGPVNGNDAAGIAATTDLITILDTVDVPVVVVQHDATIAGFNKAAVDVLGISLSDIGRAPSAVPTLAGLPLVEQLCDEVMSTRVEARADLRDGDRWLVVRISPWTRGDREGTGVVLTFANVTAFRASLEQAVYERECTKAILNTFADPLVVLSADQRIQSGNRAFFALFETSRDWTQGAPFHELGDGAFELEPFRGQLTRMIAGSNEFQPVEVDHVVTAKGQRTLLLDARPLSFPGHSEREVLVTFQDITAHKQAQAAKDLRSEEELRRSEAAVIRLADEQAALQRVATLVARGVSPADVFAAVTDEVGGLFGSEAAIARFEADGSAMVVVGLTKGIPVVSIGTRWPLEDFLASTTVYRTGRPARNDHTGHRNVSGSVAESLRTMDFVSTVSAPIVVEGDLWGVMTVSDRREPLPPDTEERVARFTELVATAISNAEARRELHRVAAEQEALRMAATLVASGASPAEVFEAITVSAAEVFDVPFASLIRVGLYEAATMVAGCAACSPYVGTTWTVPADDPGITRTVVDSCRPSRIEDHSRVHGPVGEAARALGVGSVVGAPVVVDSSVWGVLAVGAAQNGPPLAPDAADRLASFAELVSTAIVNTEARDQVRRLLDEQAALRRVATLIAEGASPDKLFAAVAQEVADVVGIPVVGVQRYEADRTFTMMGIAGDTTFTVGSRWPVEEEGVAGMILATGRPARKEDYSTMSGPLGDAVREDRMVSTAGAPIVVDGLIWGFMVVAGRPGETIPPGTELRLARFTELVATAISNAAIRADLLASRARVLAAAHEARRRIERDLHDGAQQRLVTLAVELRNIEAQVPPGLDELRAEVDQVVEGMTDALDELREMSRGIHPAVLSQGGLSPALKALGRRSTVPVELDLHIEHRLPDQIEIVAYYIVSEALANASKHANAARVWVSVRVEDEDILHLSIRDDGAGGADPSRGSGLISLRDRAEALGGTIDVVSPVGAGTRIDVEIPVAALQPADSPSSTERRSQA